MVSQAFREAVYAAETSEAALVLLTLDSPEMQSPQRFTSDGTETISRGNTFNSFPFAITLPIDDPENVPRAKLEIDNVDRQIVTQIRLATEVITVLVEIVLASTPDTVEQFFSDFELRNVEYGVQNVSGDLVVESFLQERYPSALFDPARFPGGF